MKVLLTGITGFVGQSLMPVLAKECPNHEFLTININKVEAIQKYPTIQYPNFKHINISELDKVLLFNPDITIHLATVTTASNSTEMIKPMLEANIEFGVFLLDVLSKCTNMKLFVNTGSFAEYRLGPQNFSSAYLYSACKTAFRSFVDFYSELSGFKYITAIPYSVYGGNMTVKRLMDYLKESLDSTVPIDMTAGEQILDFIHVNDIAGFYVHVLNEFNKYYNLKNNGQEFHLGTGRGTSIRELAKMIEKKYKKKCNINWGGRPYRNMDIMHAVAPISKNIQLTGWKARISLNEGI